VSTAIATKADAAEAVLLGGNLEALTPEQRTAYMLKVCESLGLNPLTKPFEFVRLSGKLVMYARKDCTEQLRRRDRVSVSIVARELVGGVYVVTARAALPDGRTDESVGAVPVQGLQGEALANAYMKAETKAKRRVTLSICGLGLLDETEVESAPGATPVSTAPPPKTPALPAGVTESRPATTADEVFDAIAVVAELEGSETQDVMQRLFRAIKTNAASLEDLTPKELAVCLRAARKKADDLRAEAERPTP
jgi:hypothetical protein